MVTETEIAARNHNQIGDSSFLGFWEGEVGWSGEEESRVKKMKQGQNKLGQPKADHF